MADYKNMTSAEWLALVNEVGYEAARDILRNWGTTIDGIPAAKPNVTSAPLSVTPPKLAAPQGNTMDETEEVEAAGGALSAAATDGALVAPSPSEWTSWQKRNADLQEQQAAMRKQQFEQGQQIIQQMYGGPSPSERMWALSRALLSPRRYKGLAGTLDNLTQSYADVSTQSRTAEKQRAEALLRLQNSYQDADMKSAESGLERELQLLQARYKAGKPATRRTGFNPLNGKLQFMDTGEDVGAPPPPKVGEIRDGYRYVGGDFADENNWVKVR